MEVAKGRVWFSLPPSFGGIDGERLTWQFTGPFGASAWKEGRTGSGP